MFLRTQAGNLPGSGTIILTIGALGSLYIGITIMAIIIIGITNFMDITVGVITIAYRAGETGIMEVITAQDPLLFTTDTSREVT